MKLVEVRSVAYVLSCISPLVEMKLAGVVVVYVTVVSEVPTVCVLINCHVWLAKL